MKSNSKITQCLCAAAALALFCGTAFNTHASGKTTDPAGAPSTGGAGGGGGTSTGGGGKPGTVAPAPAPMVTTPLTFSAYAAINGVQPLCSGSYHVDPYYPTLSLMTVSVNTSSVNVPDGTALYVNVVCNGSTYGIPTGYIYLTAGSGACSVSGYVVPGTTVSAVTVTDAAGNPVFLGN